MQKVKMAKLSLRFSEPTLEEKFKKEQEGFSLVLFKINTVFFSLISLLVSIYLLTVADFHLSAFFLTYILLTIFSHIMIKVTRSFLDVKISCGNIISITIFLEAYFQLFFLKTNYSVKEFFALTAFFLFSGVVKTSTSGWQMYIMQQIYFNFYYQLRPLCCIIERQDQYFFLRVVVLLVSIVETTNRYFKEKSDRQNFMKTEAILSHEKILRFFLEEVHPDPTFLVNFKEYFQEHIVKENEKIPPSKPNFLKKVTSYFLEFQPKSISSKNSKLTDKKLDEVKQSSDAHNSLIDQPSISASINYSSGSNHKNLKINTTEEMYQFLQNIEVVSCIWPRAIAGTEKFLISKSTRVTDILNILFTENVNFNDLSVTESRMSISRISGSFKSVRNFDLMNMKKKKKTIDRISTIVKGNYIIPDKGIRCVVNLKLSKFFYENMPWIFIFFQDSTQKAENKYLKDLDKFKDKLLASVTHDLRTPLNMIMVMLDNARMSKSREVLLDSLNLADVNANLLQSLISDILDHSLFKENRIRLIITEFSLSQLIGDVMRLFQFQAAKKGVCLKYLKNFSEPDLMFVSDCRRVKQILINLVSNSLKFTSRGLIAINVQEIENDDKYILIEVIDTGSGIKNENITQLFRPFATFENNSGENANGIGLGLNICKTLVGFLGPFDHMFITTRYGMGTKIGFFLNKILQDYAASEYSNATIPNKPKMEALCQEFRYWDEEDEEETNIMNFQYDIEMINEKPALSSHIKFNLEKSPFQKDSERVSTNNQSIPSLMNMRELINKQPQQQPATHYVPLIPESQRLYKQFSRDNAESPGAFSDLFLGNASLKNILIVDDNMFNLYILENYLNKLGRFNVIKASDGETAFKLFKDANEPSASNPISLIFLDLNLPDRSGLEIASDIVDNVLEKGFQKVVICACTSYTGETEKKQAFDSGVDYFLTKPLQKEELQNFVKKVLG